jgi:hypothetical protein
MIVFRIRAIRVNSWATPFFFGFLNFARCRRLARRSTSRQIRKLTQEPFAEHEEEDDAEGNPPVP